MFRQGYYEFYKIQVPIKTNLNNLKKPDFLLKAFFKFFKNIYFKKLDIKIRNIYFKNQCFFLFKAVWEGKFTFKQDIDFN